MKAIIQIQHRSSHNSELEFFSHNLLNLKVCGKDLLSYYLDLLNELEVDEIFIFSKDIKKIISSFYLSEVFSPKIKFIKHSTVDDFYKDNKNMFEEQELLMIENIGFIFNSFVHIKEEIQSQKKNFVVKDNGFNMTYIINHNKPICVLNEYTFFNIKAIKTLEDYIFTVDSILENIDEVDYALGYSKIDGIVVGKNVKIDKSTKLIAPVVIQDNVSVLSNCTLGPNTIISNNVFIEDDTIISNTIVVDNTYIGTNLALENKMVIENKIIDKQTLVEHEIDKRLISRNK